MKTLLSAIVIFALFLPLNSCDFSFSTAHIDNIKMCSSMIDNQCTSDNPQFNTGTPEIFISCQLKNAPENTNVEFAWYYLGKEKIKIDAVRLNSGDRIGTLKLHSSLMHPNNGWPTGEYEVMIRILDTSKEPVIKKFIVK
jgi:hypothetical protein